MKYLLIVSLSLTSLAAFAMKDMKNLPLDQQKKMKTSYIDQKIESLQSMKSCVNSAKDEKALGQCKEEAKQAMEDYKEHQEEVIDQKEEVLEEEGSVLDKAKDEVEDLTD